MQRRRIAALAAAPTTLLIGLAIFSTSAADASTAKAPTAVSATCNAPTSNEVLTVQEGIALVKRCSATKAASAVPGWHWMGNYGSVYDVVNVANGGGIGAGELIAQPGPTGLVPAFMYY
ncbi:hypothetical protein [Streptomyces sp. NPDC051662]|uniref:hypothetical protein n=1 Tax=Streptomyces sp. NPDC051662 TaxID=3154750 RepID=UPI0034422F4D